MILTNVKQNTVKEKEIMTAKIDGVFQSIFFAIFVSYKTFLNRGSTISVEYIILLITIGLAVGCIGTLIGAGGGFVLMPVLMLMNPSESPELLTSISLAVVFFNALSGSAAYAKMKRIDFKSGLFFSAATIPGAVLGALTVSMINRHIFNIIFGVLLIAISIFLFIKPRFKTEQNTELKKGHSSRTLTDLDGTTYSYSFNLTGGIILSLFVGYISSLLGIGGGIIHVPAMVNFLNFPIHIATATSHFVLAIMALAGTLVHIFNGSFSKGMWTTLTISGGVLIGAQIGARLSNKIHGLWIIRGLALALGLVGIRMLVFSA